MISVAESKSLKLHLTADTMKVDNSISLTCYLAVRNPVVFCGDTRGIKLAPYNVLCHSKEKNGLLSSNLVYDRNLTRDCVLKDAITEAVATAWSTPLFCNSSQQNGPGGDGGEYFFVNPKDVIPLVVPGFSPTSGITGFGSSSTGGRAGLSVDTGTGESISPKVVARGLKGSNLNNTEKSEKDPASESEFLRYLILPEVYAQVLEQKKEEVSLLQSQLSANLKREIGDQFKNWLKQSGKIKQLQDLAKIQLAQQGQTFNATQTVTGAGPAGSPMGHTLTGGSFNNTSGTVEN